MDAIIFDTETTGIDEPELIQVAWIPVDVIGERRGLTEFAMYRPSKAISLGALATHHIMDEELADYPPSTTFRLPDRVRYLIGFNIDFDWRVIGEPGVRRIDVCAMCRSLWPDADSHSQAAMCYLLERQRARELLRSAHDARQDVEICRLILQHVVKLAGPFETFDALWRFSERARVPTRMPFGKHRGELIASIPSDYKRWLLRQPDVDPYLLQAVQAR